MQIALNNAATVRRALIVHAHPEPDSFSTAQMKAAAEGLGDGGYEVEIIDLYQEEFAPVLDRHEFGIGRERFKPALAQAHAYREDTLAGDVSEHLSKLMHADLVILSFPMWWYSSPAILKGWLDRVLIPGALFDAEREFETAPLHGVHAQFLITTGVESAHYGPNTRYGAVDDLLLPLTRSLEYIGLTVQRPLVTWRPTKLSPKDRGTRLSAVTSHFRESALLPALETRASTKSDSTSPQPATPSTQAVSTLPN